MIGKRVEYIYDSKGNLISVTDQTGAKTEFTYLTDTNRGKKLLRERGNIGNRSPDHALCSQLSEQDVMMRMD
jgi:YD repeat-containing protein